MRKEASIFNLEIFRLVETKFFFLMNKNLKWRERMKYLYSFVLED